MRKLSDLVYNQRPITMQSSDTVVSACERMRDTRAGSVLITDPQGRLLGIFTGRDAVCRGRRPPPGTHASRRRDDAITGDPHTQQDHHRRPAPDVGRRLPSRPRC